MKHANRVLAALLSLAIIVVGGLLIIEVVADRINHRPALVHWHHAYEWLGRTEWLAGSVRVTCVLLILVGLVLLAAELKPPRVSRLRVSGSIPNTDTAYTRRGVATAVQSAVADVDGIRDTSISVSRRKVRLAATAGAADNGAAQQLREPVVEAAQQRLDALQLESAPSLSATIKPRRS
ncbi:MAG: hypothetical protein JWN95_1852 [Frankiales bacterium]|nr:hypothetical protein [Frankiales bacterium]